MRQGTLVIALALAACAPEKSETVSNIDATASPAAEMPLTAKAVADKLTAAGLPIENVVVVDEATDSNKLMGRPGQYVSKVYFGDRRHAGEGMEPKEQNTVETFASEADATRRREYVQKVTEGMPMFTQYIIQSGPVVVRLDKALTPAEAKEYESALALVP